MAEPFAWDARAYDAAASAVQRRWGRALLESHAWRGDEVVLDAGCGPGALAADLLERLPQGRIVALDRDPSMVAEAGRRLAPYGPRAHVVRRDLLQPLDGLGPFDVVFSNAVLHWLPDHARVFRHFHDALHPGGGLLCQCGGQGNLAAFHRAADVVTHGRPFAPHFRDWSPPWHLEDAPATRDRLEQAGFSDVRVALSPLPVEFPDAAGFKRFCQAAPLLPYLARLSSPGLGEAFVEAVAKETARAVGAWRLDYIRLTMTARRPGRITKGS